MEHKEFVEEVKGHFYWLHRHPELSGEEFGTTEYLKKAKSQTRKKMVVDAAVQLLRKDCSDIVKFNERQEKAKS